MYLAWVIWCVLAVAAATVRVFSQEHWVLGVATGILYYILLAWMVIVICMHLLGKRKKLVNKKSGGEEASAKKNGFWFVLLVQYPFVMLLGAGLVSLFAAWHLFAEMLTHFTWQMMLGWSYLCVTTLLVRHYKMLLVSVILWGIYAVQIAPFYLPNAIIIAQEQTSLPLRVLHYNVKGNNPNRESIAKWISTQKPDVVLLQETSHEWEDVINGLAKDYPYQLKNYISDNYFGAVLLSQYPLQNAEIRVMGEGWNYYFSAMLQRDATHEVQLYAIHAHPPFGEKGAAIRNEQLRMLGEVIKSTGDKTTLVMGDLNLTPYSPYFKDFLSQTGLQNSMLGFGVQNSWPSNLPLWLMGIAIDHVLVSRNIEVTSRYLGDDLGSDHMPVMVEIRLPPKGGDGKKR